MIPEMAQQSPFKADHLGRVNTDLSLCYIRQTKIKWLALFLDMDSRLFIIVVCCICASLAGCMAHIYTPYQRQGRLATHHQPLKNTNTLFSTPLNPLKIEETPYADKKHLNYKISFLKFPSVGDNGQPNNAVEAVYYRSTLPGRHRLLIVLPIWGGSTFPSKMITEPIYRHSKGYINVIRVQGKNNLLNINKLEQAPTIKQFRHMLKTLVIRTKNTTIDIKRLVNWATHQKNISPHQISIIGFSRGTIIAGLVAQTDPHITNAIYVVGGPNPADMLYHCDYYELRRKITARFHWSNEKFFSVLHTYLSPAFNIVHYPARLDPRHILIFDAYFDTCISKKSRHELWSGMGKPERYSFLYGHQLSFGSMTIGGLYFMPRKIIQFIEREP